jgi:hypothetical protein
VSANIIDIDRIINWMFSTEKAREKLAKAYPKIESKES